METTTAKYTVRITSANGLARYESATSARDAKRIAADRSRNTDTIEADILVHGDFAAAFINGAEVIW